MLNELKQSMELLQNGLNEHIYLRKALMTLSKYFKYRGYDKDINKNMLIDWISKQSEDYYGSKYYRYTWEDILRFIEDINNNTYKNSYRFIDKIEVPVTLGEMEQINMLKNKGDKLVAFSMLFLSKVYKNKDNKFYASYPKISELSGFKERQVFNSVQNLKKYGVINIVESNKVKKTINVERGYKVYKHPNTYSFLLKEEGTLLVNLTNEFYLINDFYKIYNICINEYDFNVSYRFKKQIKKYCASKVISI